MTKLLTLSLIVALALVGQAPQAFPGGYALPNGWRITPVGKAIPTEDLILNITASKDERVIIAQHGGFNPHGLLVIDAASQEAVQRIGLRSAWLGLAWSADGSKLYVSGGNASGARHTSEVAPIYVFQYANGRLSEKPAVEWRDDIPPNEVYWTGLAMHPSKNLLYAGNRGADPNRGNVTVFDTSSGKVVKKITVEVSRARMRRSSSPSTAARCRGRLLWLLRGWNRLVGLTGTAVGRLIPEGDCSFERIRVRVRFHGRWRNCEREVNEALDA